MPRLVRLLLAATALVAFADVVDSAKIPKMRWNEDKENIYLRLLIKGAQNDKVKVTITDDSFSFTAEDAKGTEYSASFEIREDVKSSECKHDVKGNEIFVQLVKAHAHNWDRLAMDPKPLKGLLIKDFGNIAGNVGMSNFNVGDTDDVEDEVEKLKNVKMMKSESEFEEVVAKNDLVVADFFYPWCNDCSSMTETFSKVAKKLKKEAAFVRVDAREIRKLGRRFGVACNSTCHYTLFKRDEPELYWVQHKQKTSELVTELKPYLGPSVKSLKPADVAKFAAKPRVAAVGVFASKDDEAYKAFRLASFTELRKEVKFGAVIASTDEFVGTAPAIKVKRKFDIDVDGGEAVYPALAWDNKTLVEWLVAEKSPILSEWTWERKKEFEDAKVAMGQLFIDIPASYETEKDPAKEKAAQPFKQLVSKVAHHFKGSKIQFVFCSLVQLNYMLEDVGLDKDTAPAFAINDYRTDKKYAFEGELTEENLKVFVQAVLDGTQPPAYKSEKIPTEEELAKSTVRKVVQKTFAKDVEQADADVLLELHTDWGSKHKAVIPVLENCSAVLSAVGSSVRFASMESSKNSELKEMYDDKWTYDKYKDFTIFFIQKGSVQTPIKLEQEEVPSAKSIIEWIHEHSSEPKFDLAEALKLLDEREKAEQLFKEQWASEHPENKTEAAAEPADTPDATTDDAMDDAKPVGGTPENPDVADLMKKYKEKMSEKKAEL